MNNLKINNQIRQLDSLFDKISSMRDDELKAELTKYLCVRVTGLIENGVEEILVEYTKKGANPSIQSFVVKELEKFQSPKWGNISKLLGDFNQNWYQELEQWKIENPAEASSIDSVVYNRNSIAHGGSQAVGFVIMRQYYENVKKMLEKLEKICK